MTDDQGIFIEPSAITGSRSNTVTAVRATRSRSLASGEYARQIRERHRIVLVVPDFPKLSESFIVSKFLGLLERGWDVHIVCQTSDAAQWQHFPELKRSISATARVHRCWIHRPRWIAMSCVPAALLHCAVTNPRGTAMYVRRSLPRRGVGAVRRLYVDSAIVALRPSIVHFEFGPLALGRMDLADTLKCKTVVSFRGYDLNFSGIEDPGYYRDVWQNADCLHLLGQDLWRRAQLRGCPVDKPHCLIPPAIDVEYFQPSNGFRELRDGRANYPPLRVVSVGRLEWKKGYEYGLQAIRRLRERGVDCRYEIIGAGAYLEAIAFARHQLGLGDVVQLTGASPRDQIRSKLDEADVFLHPAVSEGFCNAVLEAQAMQLPVVCADAGGLPENIVDGETGFVIPRRDPVAMADRLNELAVDPDLRQRMGLAGRRRVLEAFTLNRQLDAIEAMYTELLVLDRKRLDKLRQPAAGR